MPEPPNEALATEIVCVLRYRRHRFMARRIHGQSVGAEFLVPSNDALVDADRVAVRIAIDSGHDRVRYLSDRDSTTSELLEQILAVEEPHADDLADLLEPTPDGHG